MRPGHVRTHRAPGGGGFWAGRVVSFLGTEFTLLGLPLLALSVLGLGPFAMGLLIAVAGLPALAGPLFAGPLADVLNRKWLCVGADVVRGSTLLASVPLYLTGQLNLPVLIVMQLVLGTAEAIFDTSFFAWLPDLFRPDALVSANGRLESLRGVAQLLGPALAGGLVQAVTAAVALLVDGVSYVFSALTLSAVRPRPSSHSGTASPSGEPARRRYWTLLVEGFQVLRSLPAVALLGVSSGVFNLFAGAAEAVFFYVIARELQFSPALMGVVLSAGCAGGALSGLLVARFVRRFGLRTMLTAGLAASCVAEFATAAAPDHPVVAPVLIASAQFVATFGVVAYIAANATLRQALIPSPARGRVFAALRVLTRGAVPVGAVLGGLVAVWWSARGGLLLAGLGQVGAACWLFSRRSILPTQVEGGSTDGDRVPAGPIPDQRTHPGSVPGDDTPAPDARVWPYPKSPPVRNIGRKVPEGRVIAVEGPDGAGKSTQIALLAARLRARGMDVAVCSYLHNPLVAHSSAHGKWLNWDPYTMAMTYAAALTDLVNREVIPHSGKPDGVVILDRYYHSIVGRAEVRGCPRRWLLPLVEPARLPHILIQLRTPLAECLARKRRSAHGFSYWESGIDAFGADHLRMGEAPDDFAASFWRYQEAVQAVVDDLLVGTDALVVSTSDAPDAIAARIETHVLDRVGERAALSPRTR